MCNHERQQLTKSMWTNCRNQMCTYLSVIARKKNKQTKTFANPWFAFTFLFLLALPLPLPPVNANSGCVCYTARRGPWSLRRGPPLLARSRRQRSPGSLGRSGPGWPPGWGAGPCPRGSPGTALQPGPGTSRSLHPRSPGDQSRAAGGRFGWEQRVGVKNTGKRNVILSASSNSDLGLLYKSY